MPCYHPLKAYQCQTTRQVRFSPPRAGSDYRSITLPCSQCVGCRLERSRQWAIRCVHEASLYERNCFITLTYNNENLPGDRSLHYDDFQKFMKRLRFSYKGHRLVDGTYPIRFYMCGEYGEKVGRPHYHACIFNFDFDDKTMWMKTDSGSKIYRSKQLEELWTFGFSSIGEVNFQSAAYVARYIMKKMSGDAAAAHYEYVDPTTGEIHSRRPEFTKMSLKPGIGARWFKKYTSDVFKLTADGDVAQDAVFVNGRLVKPPRYYDKKFKDEYPLEWDAIEQERLVRARECIDDNTPERLKVKEQLTVAKLSMLKRKLT